MVKLYFDKNGNLEAVVSDLPYEHKHIWSNRERYEEYARMFGTRELESSSYFHLDEKVFDEKHNRRTSSYGFDD